MKHVKYHVSMFYGIKRANDLKSEFEKENNFQYDLVVKIRPDIRFGTVFNYEMFPEKYKKIYLPKIATYCIEGLNDQVAISSSTLMDKYCELYPKVIDYYRYHTTTARPEAMVKYHLTSLNIPFERIDIIYDIYRLNGKILRQEEMVGRELEVQWK